MKSLLIALRNVAIIGAVLTTLPGRASAALTECDIVSGSDWACAWCYEGDTCSGCTRSACCTSDGCSEVDESCWGPGPGDYCAE